MNTNINQIIKWALIAIGATLLSIVTPWIVTWTFPTGPDIVESLKAGLFVSLGYIFKIFMNGHVNDPTTFDTINFKEWMHGLLTTMWGAISAALTLWFQSGFPSGHELWVQIGAIVGVFLTYCATTYFQGAGRSFKKA